MAESSLSQKTNKTKISKNFFSQSSFNSEDSLPVTQQEQHHIDDSISTEISSLIDCYNTATNEPLKNQENQKQNQENIENQKKRKTPAIAELVRPIRSTNSTEHNRVQSTLNFNTSNEVTHISINKPNKNTTTQSTNLNSNTTNNNTNQNTHTKINSQNAETGCTPISQQQTSQPVVV